MWRKLKTSLWRSAIGQALGKPAPDRIPMGGRDRTAERNYHSAYLGEADEPVRVLITGMNNEGVEGLWFEQAGRRGSECSIPNSSIADFQLRIISYIRELQIEYTSAVKFFIHGWLLIPWVKLFLVRAGDFFYNRKKLARSDRMKVLVVSQFEFR